MVIFLRATSIKFQLTILMHHKAEITIALSKVARLFSQCYCWNIAHLALSNNHWRIHYFKPKKVTHMTYAPLYWYFFLWKNVKSNKYESFIIRCIVIRIAISYFTSMSMFYLHCKRIYFLIDCYASSLYACALQMIFIVYVAGAHGAIESIAANRYA